MAISEGLQAILTMGSPELKSLVEEWFGLSSGQANKLLPKLRAAFDEDVVGSSRAQVLKKWGGLRLTKKPTDLARAKNLVAGFDKDRLDALFHGEKGLRLSLEKAGPRTATAVAGAVGGEATAAGALGAGAPVVGDTVTDQVVSKMKSQDAKIVALEMEKKAAGGWAPGSRMGAKGSAVTQRTLTQAGIPAKEAAKIASKPVEGTLAAVEGLEGRAKGVEFGPTKAGRRAAQAFRRRTNIAGFSPAALAQLLRGGKGGPPSPEEFGEALQGRLGKTAGSVGQAERVAERLVGREGRAAGRRGGPRGPFEISPDDVVAEKRFSAAMKAKAGGAKQPKGYEKKLAKLRGKIPKLPTGIKGIGKGGAGLLLFMLLEKLIGVSEGWAGKEERMLQAGTPSYTTSNYLEDLRNQKAQMEMMAKMGVQQTIPHRSTQIGPMAPQGGNTLQDILGNLQ
jgi:hypothetical protein